MTGTLMIANNLEDLAEAIGAYLGMAEGVQRPQYMDVILTRAYRVADRKFNVAAAAAAKPKDFTHMYEFNTTGVTPGDNKFKPTHQAARLWKSVQLGNAGRKTITYVFRPATQANPAKQTGDIDVGDIDQDVLDKLRVNTGERKYVWRNKAEAKEKGHVIWIQAKESPLLFVPTVQGLENEQGFETARGYGWRKKNAYRLNEQDSQGAFSAFFFGWWTTAGSASVSESIIRYVNNDVRKFASSIGMKRGAVKPASMVMVNARAEASFKKTVKQWQIKVIAGEHNNGVYAEEDKVL